MLLVLQTHLKYEYKSNNTKVTDELVAILKDTDL